MQSSGRMRAQITTLIIATSLVQLANGFFGTFISLRVAMEDFGSTMAGLVLSSYFAGFTVAAFRCGRIITDTSVAMPPSPVSSPPRPRPWR